MLFVLILVVSLLAQFFLPWWSIALVCFALAFWKARYGGQAFLAGFLAIGLTWLGGALFWHLATDGLLSSRVAAMLTVNSPWILMAVTVLVGALVGGTSALSGYLVRRLWG
ncbi:hypothetical protein ACD591_14370 [Rufibacter glacialis]|uniref:Uncharacterized protein n=1 Tax=Rufibacter glacialis TaxID=1259555 RepID=A0A5M8Q6V3_9BACT|nr:hypothetical protein [Rufibacter glacialis]KAA6430973.1 hypothetical protein FOE74_17860 [Rufibacter glacialis]GGK82954.1 hypothetical protein GCM10011405_33490 [Rufibacter glacialis]